MTPSSGALFFRGLEAFDTLAGHLLQALVGFLVVARPLPDLGFEVGRDVDHLAGLADQRGHVQGDVFVARLAPAVLLSAGSGHGDEAPVQEK